MIVAAAIFGGEQDDEAHRVGFLGAADQRAAKDAGVAWRAASEAKGHDEQDQKAHKQIDNAELPKAPFEQGVASGNRDADASQNIYAGRVLPFTVIRAIRNYGFKDGMRPAQVSISVEGGTQADWMATAAYVAEQSIVNDVTFAQVEIYIPNPWADFPPTHSKMLAKAYYSGPDPKKSPWPDEQWAIFSASHAATLADIEFNELSNDLIEKLSPKIQEPQKLGIKAEEESRKLLIQKYHLPRNWMPADNTGLNGAKISRNQIHITSSEGVAFICDKCSPPIDIRGAKPSWAK